MGLMDEARALTKRPGTQTSKILRVVDGLTGKARAEVISLVWDHDPNISSRAIGEVLTKHYAELAGGEITGGQVDAHRRDKPRPE